MLENQNNMLDKRIIEQVLYEQYQEISGNADEYLCPRREEEQIDMESSMAQVVLGVRRSGKSTMCYNVLKQQGEKFAYVNFDDERLDGMQSSEFNLIMEVLYKIYGDFRYLFLDEIQNVEGWHLFVNRLLRQKMHVLVTGSNARLLSGELATHLTGRYEPTELFPFSFQEYCMYKGVNTVVHTTKEEAFLRAAFDEYLHQGGFPELMKKKNKTRYINTLVENILKRDIEQRYRIRYEEAFERLSHHLLNVAPVIVATNSLAEQFGLGSHHTADKYIGFLEQAYLLLSVRRYSPKSRQRIREEKVYPVDVALMDGRADAFVGENLGWRLESVVYLELLRRNRPIGRDIYYFRNNDGYEADFIVCKGNKAEEIYQVCYDISKEKTRKRELRGLFAASKDTGCNNLCLITDHERETVESDGSLVKILPAYEWLCI